ncbi:hypothetical protein [Gimesia aquarii]|uniref:Uncharacterized protein n=1 Tax=Gimesia aquarii TaxID=2527964 RepID=A0A517WV44_9PLAN|nr:hypothetical protein [Gimesia aquarii]QDU09139.1 hypothetical protein V202x_25110 [Gimesia aquarii]
MNQIFRQVRFVAFFLLSMILGFYGCHTDDTESNFDLPLPEAEPLHLNHSKPSMPKTQVSGKKKYDGIVFHVPEGWEEVPLSPAQQGLISASFRIPKAGDQVKLTLSSVGGGIDANLQRWRGQFQLPPGETPTQETIRVDNTDVIWLDLRGTFESGIGLESATKSGMRMIGVAIPRSPRDFYLKLTGPRDQLMKVEKEFRKFVKSARFAL